MYFLGSTYEFPPQAGKCQVVPMQEECEGASFQEHGASFKAMLGQVANSTLQNLEPPIANAPNSASPPSVEPSGAASGAVSLLQTLAASISLAALLA